MSAQRFSTGKCFHWQGVSYEVRRLLPKGTLELAAVFTGETIVVELTVLIEALFAGKLWFVSAAQGVALETAPHAQSENHTLELADYPEHLVAIARRRLEVIRPLL